MNRAGMVSEEEEELHSVFRARAELMQWAAPPRLHCPLLWTMNEAELTAGSAPSRTGWVQVGLEAGVVEPIRARPASVPGWAAFPERRRNFVEPARTLPALIQCFDDALSRFGVIALSGLQVTAKRLEPSTRSYADYLRFGTQQDSIGSALPGRRAPRRSSPLTASCSGAIPRPSWSLASIGVTPDRSRSAP